MPTGRVIRADQIDPRGGAQRQHPLDPRFKTRALRQIGVDFQLVRPDETQRLGAGPKLVLAQTQILNADLEVLAVDPTMKQIDRAEKTVHEWRAWLLVDLLGRPHLFDPSLIHQHHPIRYLQSSS